jgi:hypothetical protein
MSEQDVRIQIEQAFRRGELQAEDRDRLLKILEESGSQVAKVFLDLFVSIERLKKTVARQ